MLSIIAGELKGPHGLLGIISQSDVCKLIFLPTVQNLIPEHHSVNIIPSLFLLPFSIWDRTVTPDSDQERD